jgi:hypothetical protein
VADPHGRDLTRGLAALAEEAKRDIRAALDKARTPEHARFILTELLPTLIDLYGVAAATLAADWYDEVRSQLAIAGRFRAEIPRIGDPGVPALLGWAIDEATSLKAFEELTIGGSVRRIQDYGRATVTHSAVRDPGSTGWQRVGSGECDFCRMLIGRGAVYSESTVRFASHDHCNCSAVAVFKGSEPVPVREYERSERSDRTDDEARRESNERVRAWLEANPDVG